MKRIIIVLFTIIFMVGCGMTQESNEPQIKTLTEQEYQDLKGKPEDELSEDELIQVANYEETSLAKANNNLPLEYLNYVEDNYSKEDTDIRNAERFVNNKISIVFFYNSNTMGIFGGKSQKEEVKNELKEILSHYDIYEYDETFIDKLPESKDEYVYMKYGDTEIRGK